MKVLEAKFVKQFINLCFEGYQKGWHERNGGNLSYRIRKKKLNQLKKILLIKMKEKLELLLKI